jgi:hypothetical protein
MAVLPKRPRFVYGTGGDVTTWTTRLPARPWDYSTPTVGGSRTAASGVPAGYVVRRDFLLDVRLRLYETELADLDALVQWGQLSETITFYPDALETGESFLVYLEHPVAGEEWRPVRLQEYPRVLEVTLTLRRVADTPFELDYFACEA